MSARVTAWLAWSLWALVVAFTALGLLLVRAARPTPIGNFILGPVLLACGTVGALVASRRPENHIGWVLCASSVLGAVYLFAAGYAMAAFVVQPGSLPGGVWPAWIASWAGKAGFALLFVFMPLLFPDGHLPSPRWRPAAWLAAGWIALIVAATMLVPGTMNEAYPSVTNPFGQDAAGKVLDLILKVAYPALVVFAILPTLSLIVRLRRAGREARQQLKWVAFASILLLVWVVLDAWLPPTPQAQLIDGLVLMIALMALPVAIGVAVLRYRLYDIDLIIHRTLVYSLLSALLAPAYFGSVVALQAIFRTVSGETSPIAIVVSTLGIAALFFPLRRRVQAFIDRRFYRRKYDAAATLAAFAATARDETNLDELTERLVDVVQETMQPEVVALWLAERER